MLHIRFGNSGVGGAGAQAQCTTAANKAQGSRLITVAGEPQYKEGVTHLSAALPVTRKPSLFSI